MELLGVSFVMLGTTDKSRSMDFYRDRLGLRLVHEFEGFAFFDGGGVTIGLTTDLGDRIHNGAVFASEVVFAVPSVTAAYDELRATGVTFAQAPRVVNGESWAAACTDPDGHLISFYGSR